jgi:hypothetical protein
MSTTDLLNGPVDSNLTYNIKNNCSIFNVVGNSTAKINYYRSALLAIAWNAPNFLNIVLDFKNLSRSYYNQTPKRFCSSVKFDGVQYFQGKYSTVYLPQPGGMIPNSIPYVEYNGTTKINMLRILGPNSLPVCWSNVVYNNGVCKNDATFDPSVLSDNEKVLYYYIKHADFFTKMLDIMTRSFFYWSEFIYFNYTAVFPADLYPGSKDDRTILLTGEFLKAVYSQYLRESRYGNPYGYKLPCPRVINPSYVLPVVNKSKAQLVRYINGNTDSFPI